MSRSERIRAFVDGELTPAETEALLEEAERDPALAEELAGAEELISTLRALEVPEPPPDLVNASVLRAVQERAKLEAQPWWRKALDALIHGRSVRLRITLPAVVTPLAAVAMLFLLLRPHAPPATSPQPEPNDPAATSEAPQPVTTGVAVRLLLPTEGAHSVAVVGDFNDWRTDADFLEDPEGDGVFSGTLRLAPGSYSYMFVVDGQEWIADPYASTYQDDGFGSRNAVLRID